ncbi:MAG: 8-oxoguanine DNA glycosylase [Methanomicrobiales archaeon]|nr:8-oxoguanine DNA glycosylase [Methanomicrobiales archaeon]
MKAYRLAPDQPFDLDRTLSCGQAFRWQKRDGWWEGVAGETPLCIRQEGGTLLYEGVTEAFLVRYCGLDADLCAILASFNRDPVIGRAIARHHGLRLLRQDPWECLISFICAQNAHIPFITRMIASIAGTFGEPVGAPWGTERAFPDPKALAGCSDDALACCRLGYRARYIRDTARMAAADPGWADRIREAAYPEAARELRRFPGVGPKVADCILLFGFGQYEAFPVDVWIRRLMVRAYPALLADRPSGREYEIIGAFARDYFGAYAGYAQEYLFLESRSGAGPE